MLQYYKHVFLSYTQQKFNGKFLRVIATSYY